MNCVGATTASPALPAIRYLLFCVSAADKTRSLVFIIDDYLFDPLFFFLSIVDTQPEASRTFLATAAVAVREVKHVASNTPREQRASPAHLRLPALRAMAQSIV